MSAFGATPPLKRLSVSCRLSVSPGCTHRYAETFAERFRGVKGHPYEQGFDLWLVPEKLHERLRWRSPKRADVMVQADWHRYQVLTKCSARLRDLLKTTLRFAAAKPHIWWGTSVEDRKYGVPRIEDLRSAPARIRFLSIEPLLEDLGVLNLTAIHWVIVGGESGPGARPMKREWVISLRR